MQYGLSSVDKNRLQWWSFIVSNTLLTFWCSLCELGVSGQQWYCTRNQFWIPSSKPVATNGYCSSLWSDPAKDWTHNLLVSGWTLYLWIAELVFPRKITLIVLPLKCVSWKFPFEELWAAPGSGSYACKQRGWKGWNGIQPKCQALLIVRLLVTNSNQAQLYLITKHQRRQNSVAPSQTGKNELSRRVVAPQIEPAEVCVSLSDFLSGKAWSGGS